MKFQFPKRSHTFQSFLQFFFGFKQMPFDRAQRDPQLGGDGLLPFVLEIVGGDDAALDIGEIGDGPVEGLFLLRLQERGAGVPSGGEGFQQIVQGQAHAGPLSAPVIIGQSVAGHGPDKSVRRGDIVPGRQ